MTREEAIKRLKEIEIRDALQEDYDSLCMAIEALEQLTSYERTINKLTKAISEQATILDKITDEISALIDWHDCPIEYDNGNDAWYCEACNQAIKIIDKYRGEEDEIDN